MENRNLVTRPNPAELMKLLAPVILLSTESVQQFEEVFAKLLSNLNVRDVVEAILARDFAETDWELHRYSRLRGLSFERRFKQSLDFQAQRVKAQRARKQQLTGTIAAQATTKPADIAEVEAMERKVLGAEIDEILSRTATELDHAHSLEKSISFHKDVETILASINRRRKDALEMLEQYRAGLGKEVERAMNEIIDVEAEVVEEPAQNAKA
jgi:hypothetical protein